MRFEYKNGKDSVAVNLAAVSYAAIEFGNLTIVVDGAVRVLKLPPHKQVEFLQMWKGQKVTDHDDNSSSSSTAFSYTSSSAHSL